MTLIFHTNSLLHVLTLILAIILTLTLTLRHGGEHDRDDGSFYYLRSDPSVNTHANPGLFNSLIMFGCITIIVYIAILPLWFLSLFQKASQRQAYLEGSSVYVGQLLWSEGFSERYSLLYR